MGLKIPKYQVMVITRMIWGTPMTLPKKNHFGVSEHGYIPQMAIKNWGTTGISAVFPRPLAIPTCCLQIPGAKVESQDLLGPGHLDCPQRLGDFHLRRASSMEEFDEEWT
jgi:hypothetical protein